MNLYQSIEQYCRLQRGMLAAYSMVPWQTGRINRLANGLASTEREIIAMQTVGEWFSEPPRIASHRTQHSFNH
jgi:hypothetical protein